MDFTFTPTHPDKKKARVTAPPQDEPTTTRSTRPTSLKKKAEAAEAANAPVTSRTLRSHVEVGVTTQIPSKASFEERTQARNEESETSAAASRPRRSSMAPKTPQKATSKENTLSPPKNVEQPREAAPKSPPKDPNPKIVSPAPTTEPTTDVSASTSPSKKRKSPSLENSDDIRETEAKSAKKSKSTSTVASASSTASKDARLESNPAESLVVVEKASEKAGETNAKSVVTLEENPVSYWDFVKPKRGDALIKRLVKEKPDGSRRLGEEQEETLRIVQSRFFQEAESLYRPEDVYISNPVNAELGVAQSYYQRIIELLEKENELLESSHRRVLSQLESLDVTPSSTPSTTTKKQEEAKTPKSKAARRKSKASAETEPNAAEVQKTDDEVAEIMRNMPPVETLLSDEEKQFLDVRPALDSNLQLAGFSRLQTKLDSLQLLIKQLGYINTTFEEKAIGISGAMRTYMVPSASINLSKIPVSSPLLRK